MVDIADIYNSLCILKSLDFIDLAEGHTYYVFRPLCGPEMLRNNYIALKGGNYYLQFQMSNYFVFDTGTETFFLEFYAIRTYTNTWLSSGTLRKNTEKRGQELPAALKLEAGRNVHLHKKLYVYVI